MKKGDVAVAPALVREEDAAEREEAREEDDGVEQARGAGTRGA